MPPLMSHHTTALWALHQQNRLGRTTVIDSKFWLTTHFYKLFASLLKSEFSLCWHIQATLTHTCPETYPQISCLRSYVVLSRRSTLSMISFWREFLFVQSWESFSFSGHSEFTHLFRLLMDLSISLSNPLNTSITDIAWEHAKDINADDVPSAWRMKYEELLLKHVKIWFNQFQGTQDLPQNTRLHVYTCAHT